MITIHQFKLLRQKHQYEYLKQSGVYLDLYRRQGNDIIALYALDSFYAELYLPKHSDEGLKIRCFSSIKKLAPYLEQVNIDAVTILLAH